MIGREWHPREIGVMRFVRKLVSKKKRRYVKDGFNLDLAYITDNIVAFGYPSEKFQAIYRNPRSEVLRFFESKHRGHYRIYNLCSEPTRQYPADIYFPGVEVVKLPFDDHNPPTIEMMMEFCKDADEYLAEDERNVIGVHCKAGKGRTGVMICALLVYRGQGTAQEMLEFYAEKRTHNYKGVTIPSQRRFVGYFEDFRRPDDLPPNVRRRITSVHVRPCPKNVNISKLDIRVTNFNKVLLSTLKNDKVLLKKENNVLVLSIPGGLPVQGETRVAFHKPGKRKPMFQFWFHSYFVEDDCLILNKNDIDKANKDRGIKKLQIDLHCTLEDDEGAETKGKRGGDMHDDRDDDYDDARRSGEAASREVYLRVLDEEGHNEQDMDIQMEKRR